MAKSSAPNPGQPVRVEGVLRELERAAPPRPPKPEQPSRAEAVLRESDVQSAERAAPARPRASALEAVRARDTRRSSRKKSRHLQREIRGLRRVGGQGSRRFGDVLSAVNPSIHCPVYYEAECEMAYVDSFDQTLCSSDKENVNPGIKTCWDDALFQFFRNEAVKSLKNDFSSFLSESHAWRKMHLVDDHSIGRDDFSSYSPKYYGEVLKSMSSHQKRVIQKFGFGSLLLFEKTHIPSSFVRWLATCVDPVSSQIIIDDSKVISLSKSSVHHVIGLPNGGSVPMPESDRGANFILSMFGLTELPHITFFGNLEFLSSATTSLRFIIFDSLDFGARIVDQTVPRISVWNGNLINFFSELDYRKKNLFGKRQLKKILACCYREFGALGDGITSTNVPSATSGSSFFPMGFKENLHLRFGSFIDAKVIDGIVDSVLALPAAKDVIVSNVLQFLTDFKAAEVKSHQYHPKLPVAGSHMVVPHNNGGVAFGFVSVNNGSESESDFACTSNTAPVLQLLKKFKSRYGNVAAVPKTYPSGLKESTSFLHPQHCQFNNVGYQPPSNTDYRVSNTITSPISRLKFSESPIGKENYAPHSFKCGTVVSNKTVASINQNVTNKAPIPVSSTPKNMPVIQSPEVEITRCRSSHNRQLELPKNIDDLYNKMANYSTKQDHTVRSSKAKSSENDEEYIVLSDNFADHILQKDSLVILQAKKALILPLPPNTCFPVIDLEIKHFCAIVDLAYTPVVQKDYAVMYSKVHCSYISLGQSLQREGHVDNFLITVFCRKLFEDNHPSRSLRHHFFSFIGENILAYNNDAQLDMISRDFLGAASASKGKRLELSNNLFFPICRSKHWFTFCVDFKYKLFIFLDSLYSKEDDFHTSIKDKLVINFF
ncbi:unnamed protein product [Alopecurus aequalis]